MVIHQLQDQFLTGLGHDQLITGHNWLFRYIISTMYSTSNITCIYSLVYGRKRVQRDSVWCKCSLAVILGRVRRMEEMCGRETPPHIILGHARDML